MAMAEAIAPCVLWVDEIEKGLAGLSSSDTSDAGTTSRVFSSLLTWLQEKESAVFVAATANRIAGLPPELLRRGRFDEIFFVDLPHAGERRAILSIHLRHYDRDPSRLAIDRHVDASEGHSGAEIEQAVVNALYDAFAAGTDLADTHLEKAIAETVPLGRTMAEEIQTLQRWARDRARPASKPM
jgi:SpoVK/Ycf46/Vps4 family AAA+-type ATPase